MGWKTEVRFPAGAKGIFLFVIASRPVLGARSASDQVRTGALSLGIKRLGRDAAHSPPPNAWRYTSTPQYVFMVWCSVM